MNKLYKYLKLHNIDHSIQKYGCNYFMVYPELNYIFKAPLINFDFSERQEAKKFLQYINKRENLKILYKGYNLNGLYYVITTKENAERTILLNNLALFINNYWMYSQHFYYKAGKEKEFSAFWNGKQEMLEATAKKKYFKATV